MRLILFAFKDIAVITFSTVTFLSGVVAILSFVGIKFEWEGKKKEVIKISKKVMFIAIVLFIIFVVLALYTSFLVKVPCVKGKTYLEAREDMEDAGLEFNIEQGKGDCIIVDQIPEAGEIVLKGDKIELIYDVCTYTVVFDSQGGDSIAEKIVEKGETLTKLPIPNKEKYIFIGWKYNGEVVKSITVERDIILVAEWEEEETTSPPLTTPKKCVITFDTQGGESISAQMVDFGDIITVLPTPTRDYYNFTGWKADNTTVSGTITVISDMTLTAQWELKATQKVLADSFNSSMGQEISREYSFTRFLWSSNPVSGYTYSGIERWTQSGSGTKYHGNIPSGFNTSHSIYFELSGTVPISEETLTSKRVVSSEFAGYVYWHWSYPIADKSIGNRYVGYYYNQYLFDGNYTTLFSALKSLADYAYVAEGKYGGGSLYRINDVTSYTETGGSNNWFRFEYYKYTYTDYIKEYKYTKQEVTTTYPSGSNIENITTYISYRPK